jgi:ankyrin repeat protein
MKYMNSIIVSAICIFSIASVISFPDENKSKSENIKGVRNKIKKGIKKISPRSQNDYSLHHAIKKGDLNKAKDVITYSTDRTNQTQNNEKNKDGETPLTLAALYNRIDIIPLLVDNYADPNQKNTSGNTPLDIAIIEKNLKAAEELINNGAKAKQQAMVVLLRDLIFENAEIEEQTKEVTPLKQSEFSFIKAIYENDIKKAKELISVNKYRFYDDDEFSSHLVDLALSLGRLKIAAALIEQGAQFSQEDMKMLLEKSTQ